MSKVPSEAFCKVHGSQSIGHLFSPGYFSWLILFLAFSPSAAGSPGASRERLTSFFLSLHRKTNGCVQPTGPFTAHPIPPSAHSHSLPLTLDQRREKARDEWRDERTVRWEQMYMM